MTTRIQRPRTLTSLGISLILLLGMAAVPASAAVANVAVGGGINPPIDQPAATPAAVDPGNIAAFYVWAQNNDSANLASFFLKTETAATPVGAYWWREGDEENVNLCVANGNLMCDFGQLNAGQNVIVLAGFRLPGSPSTSTANCGEGFSPGDAASWVCVDFQFGSNAGFVPGKNKSRGDAYHYFASVRTDLNNDASAQFPFCSTPDAPTAACFSVLSVNNGNRAGRNDVQTTALSAPAAALNSAHGTTGLAVADNFPFTCPSGLAQCAATQASTNNSFLGQWSDVDVNSEFQFALGEWIRIDLHMYGVNANQVDGVVHVWQGAGGTWHEDVISTRCADANGPGDGPYPAGYNGCFWAQNGQGNTALVSVWAQNNGNYRTF